MVATNTRAFAKQVYEKSKKLFAEAFMDLRAFNSNDRHLLEKIPEEDKSGEIKTSMLGLIWDTQEDTIVLTVQPWTQKICTKRTILSFIA